MAIGTANYHPVVIVLGAFLFVGAVAWIVVGGFLSRQTAESILRETPEYQCIATASGKSPKVQWSNLKNLAGPDTSFNVGTLLEEPGMNCIEDGDAISFAMLPEGPGAILSPIRIKGREVREDLRRDAKWADVTDATGTQRWRNDGDGYRKISP